ncbi:hypothetical protein LV457_11705 [Mycobacterium sp. MYCO198283]|uniref:hypothetical protein n=1 Tax=Mycobacterium sp. MYCO198283 TaxID=2883505 RepID=UPI001E5FF25C|nr:hypothetical protein [Mycobacterium sp. MYCO198283]MCG5432946.1 hypothetical protein [Mycobacterium sp. MYCO198283]
MFNQGFFTKIYIAADGSVDRAELQEPFVQLLAWDETVTVLRQSEPVIGTQTMSRTPLTATGTDNAIAAAAMLSRGEKAQREEAQRVTDVVLVSTSETNRTTFGGGGGI